MFNFLSFLPLTVLRTYCQFLTSAQWRYNSIREKR